MKKHGQRMLQQVTTTTCASGMLAPVERSETLQAQGAKVKASISATTCTYNNHYRLDMTNTA